MAPPRLADRILGAALWTGGRAVFARLCNLAALSILARQLQPEDFGLVAAVQVLLLWLTVAGDAGVSSAVITDTGRGRGGRVASAFSCQLGLLAGQAVLVLALGPLLLRMLHATSAERLLLVMLVTILLRGFTVVPEALLRRRLHNRKLAAADSSLDLLGAVVGIGLALSGAGVWSLVLPALVANVLRTVLIYRLARWRPRLRWNRDEAGRVVRLSGHGLATTTLGFVLNDGDTLIIQRVLGAGSLGFYNLGWTLANVSNRLITSVVATLALPALATLQAAPERLAQAQLRFVRVSAALAVPTSLTLLALAPDVVHVIYGPRWAPSVVLLQILLVFAAVRAFTSSTGSVYVVADRPDLGTKINLVTLAFYLPAVWLAASRGVVAVALAVTAVRVVFALIGFALSLRLLRVPLATGAATIGPPILAAALGSALTASVAWLMPVAPGLLRLMLLVPVAVAAQVLCGRFLARAAFDDVSAIVHRIRRRVQPSLSKAETTGPALGVPHVP